jgi:hypothetical protein
MENSTFFAKLFQLAKIIVLSFSPTNSLFPMNTHQPNTRQLVQNSNPIAIGSSDHALSHSALDQSGEGASLSPPAFQLKADQAPSNEAPIQAKLKFSGEAGAIANGLKLINDNLFGAKLEAGKTGELSLKKAPDMGPMTEQQQNMYNYLEKLINDPKMTSLKLKGDSNVVMGGGYQNSTLDINDILAFGNKGGMTSVGVMFHELVEQYWKQTKGWPYGNTMVGAHYRGIQAENAVNGTIRGEEKLISKTRNPDGSYTMVGTVEYKRPDGKTIITTLTAKSNKTVSATHKVKGQPGTQPASQPTSKPASQPASKPSSQPSTRPASRPAKR